MKNAPASALMAALGMLASGMLALPGTARALSCADGTVRVPGPDATGVPTNAVLWGYGRNSLEHLLGPNGEVVPVERRTVPLALFGPSWSSYPVLVPLEELEPDTRYTLVADDNAPSPIDPILRQVVFRTGSGPSSVPPPLPVLLGTETHAGSGFSGPQRSVSLELEHQGILIADLGSLGEVSSIDDLFLEDTTLPYEQVSSRGIEWATTDRVLHVGPADCSHWPESAGDRQNLRIGVLDLAGNFSGWVNAAIELPTAEEAAAAAEEDESAPYAPREGRPDACGFTPSRSGSFAGWLLALGAAAAALRIRRHAARRVAPGGGEHAVRTLGPKRS